MKNVKKFVIGKCEKYVIGKYQETESMGNMKNLKDDNRNKRSIVEGDKFKNPKGYTME